MTDASQCANSARVVVVYSAGCCKASLLLPCNNPFLKSSNFAGRCEHFKPYPVAVDDNAPDYVLLVDGGGETVVVIAALFASLLSQTASPPPPPTLALSS